MSRNCMTLYWNLMRKLRRKKGIPKNGQETVSALCCPVSYTLSSSQALPCFGIPSTNSPNSVRLKQEGEGEGSRDPPPPTSLSLPSCTPLSSAPGAFRHPPLMTSLHSGNFEPAARSNDGAPSEHHAADEARNTLEACKRNARRDKMTGSATQARRAAPFTKKQKCCRKYSTRKYPRVTWPIARRQSGTSRASPRLGGNRCLTSTRVADPKARLLV